MKKGDLANKTKEVEMLTNLKNARKWFIRHFLDVCKAEDKMQNRPPKHDRVPIPILGTKATATITGLNAMMAEKAEVVFMRVFKNTILRGLGSSPRNQETAQMELNDMLHKFAKRGLFPMMIGKTNRKNPTGPGFLIPLIKGISQSNLFEKRFGLKMPLIAGKEIKLATYANQPVKKERALAKKIIVAPGEMFGNLLDGFGFVRHGGMTGMNVPANAIVKVIGIGDRGDKTAAILKGTLGQVDEEWVRAFHDFFVKFGVDKDLLDKIIRHINRGGGFATDNTVKFANIEGPVEMDMSLMYHDDSSEHRRTHILLSDTWANRAMFTQEGEEAVKTLFRNHARKMRDAFKDPRKLGIWLEKLVVDDDEDPEDVGVTITAQRLSNVIRVLGPDFGSARPKIESLISKLVRKRAARPEVPGTIQFIYPHFGLDHHTLAVSKRVAEMLDAKHGELMNAVRYPMYSDGAVSWPIKIITNMDGIGVSPFVDDRLRFRLDFDGDKFITHMTRNTGKIMTREFPTEIKPASWIRFKRPARQVRKGHLGRLVKDVVSAAGGIGSNSNIGQLFRKLDAVQETAHEMDIWRMEKTRDAIREMEHGFVQPAVEGLKNEVGDMVDIKESLGAFTEEKDIPIVARSLSHTLLTGLGSTKRIPKEVFDSFPGAAIIGKSHPVLKEIKKLKAVIGDADEDNAFVDRNKLVKTIGKNNKANIPMPFVKIIFEELAGIEVPKDPNRHHHLAKEFIKQKKSAGFVSIMMGWDPRLDDRIDGGFIIQIMNIWGKARDTESDQTVAQHEINNLARELAVKIHEKIGVKRGWTVDDVKVLMMVTMMAYESRRSKGLYGGMFIFPPEYMEAAARLVDRTWLRWLAKDELAFDNRVNDMEDKLGLEHGTVGKKLKLGGIGQAMARTAILRKKGGVEKVHSLI